MPKKIDTKIEPRFETSILEHGSESIDRAIQSLNEGLPVGIPTETVYGLAAPVFHVPLILKIYEIKGRPASDPLITHIADDKPESKSWVEYLAGLQLIDVTRLTQKKALTIQFLCDQFWPGPLTLILPKLKRVPNEATAGLDTIGIRMPDHPVFQALLKAQGTPMVAPSANRFGRISPTEAEHVKEELGGKIKIILNGGTCRVGLESTVVSIEENGVNILRPGKIGRRALKNATSDGQVSDTNRVGYGKNEELLHSPGHDEVHYSPESVTIVLPRNLNVLTADLWDRLKKTAGNDPRKIGILSFSKGDHENIDVFIQNGLGLSQCPETKMETLTHDSDMDEAAQNLFRLLRLLDNWKPDIILIEPIPQLGDLSDALINRVNRAGKKL